MIEKLLVYLVPVSLFLIVALGGHYFFVRVIVREQFAERKGGSRAFYE